MLTGKPSFNFKDKGPVMSENERIAVAYSAIEKIWGDTMGWEQIETLARAVVRALDEAGSQPC